MKQVHAVRDSVRRELSLTVRARRRPWGLPGLMLAAAWGLGGGSGAEAQAPFRQELLAGFSSLQVPLRSSPELADLDADGDHDAAAGARDGTIRYFANLRTAAAPLFVEVTGSASPFAAVEVPGAAAPDLADLDADGDLDALVGEEGGGFRYFENTGNATAAAFVERTGSGNPLGGFDVGDDSAPLLADLDDDGDLDAVAGEKLGAFFYFRNTGSSNSPAFQAVSGSASPFAGIDVGDSGTPELADLDGDGDLDAVFGEVDGIVLYFRNSGSASVPAFVAVTGTANPLSPIDAGYSRVETSPELTDLDFDGDLDLVLGESGGTLLYFANTGSSGAPAFAAVTGTLSPFDGIDLGIIFCRPELADLDGDGDLDSLTGSYGGAFRYFENTGAADRPSFAELAGGANPFDGLNNGATYTSPDLADVDGDGDLDLVFGVHTPGQLSLLENTGSASLPSFVAATGSDNPFAGFDFLEATIHPELGDLDGDGDLDAVVGLSTSLVVSYFANTGSATAPAYAERTGSANPFAALSIGTPSPRLLDLDGDGDLDLAAGDFSGQIRYFANTGTPSSPAFAELTGASSPFAGIDVGYTSNPKVADLDRDGDLDALVGESNGRLVFHASTLANVFADGFETGDLSAWSPTSDL